jgi:bacteriorhodopsin
MSLAVAAQIAPRVIVPGFFTTQRALNASNYGEIMQIIAFTLFFTSSVFTFFQGEIPWLGVIPGIAAIAYWNMQHDPKNTEYYRYADWIFTTPIMLAAILITNGAPLTTILTTIGLDLVMIGSGYKGIVENDTTWFWYGMIAFVPILYILLTQKKNKYAVYLTVAVWSLYPVIYYLEETKAFTQEQTTVSFGFMDIVSKLGLVNLLHI